MKVQARTTIHEFLGDLVVYRRLEPADRRLPGLETVRRELGLAGGRIPRKAEEDYARVIAYLLRRARALERPKVEIARLLYIGDTRLLDGTAFHNIKKAGGWPGWAFIASEDLQAEARTEIEGDLYLANRWAALADFFPFLEAQNFPLDEATAVVIDLDKSALGPRGRNDKVIDRARVEAVQRTVAEVLGGGFHEDSFLEAYNELNRPPYHLFTADNQDYLSYICLMLSAGLYDFRALLADLQAGRMRTFAEFIELINRRIEEAGGKTHPGVLDIHREVYTNFRAGDPTPFKRFRYEEYKATVARMGHLGPQTAVEKLLREEITICQEVREAAQYLEEHGALLFSLSDKPDEATFPTPELAEKGFLPIHRIETEAVGESIR